MYRVRTKDLQTVEKTKTGWKKSKKVFPELLHVVPLYKKSNRFKELIDTKNPEFLRGWYSQGPKGARITTLPNGKKLEKAFSLFSPDLNIHDQDSHDHWDVMYKNKGGTYAYVYTLEKRAAHRKRKYKKVDAFEKIHEKLLHKVKEALHDIKDHMALPMYTLLTTYMRVGNEIYYKAHGHKGLTTIKKADVKLAHPTIHFTYVGKDGVPISIKKRFPDHYTKRLDTTLKKKKKDAFVFDKKGKVLHENDFKKAFKKYCGEEFYPHIVRSHYATMKVKNFLKNRKKVTKKEVEQLYQDIAKALGHKKYNKKKKEWQENHTVTVHSYIQPELVKKIERLQK